MPRNFGHHYGRLRETGTVIDDGLHEIYVNAAVDDGSDIADLMSCFVKKEVNNPKFPNLSSEIKTLKDTTGGTDKMCTVMQDLMDMSRNEGISIGHNAGMQDAFDALVKQGLITPEVAQQQLLKMKADVKN